MESNKDISSAIKEIIESNFIKDDYFDSHTIINFLQKKEYHQIYLENFPKEYDVKTYHSQIAKEIRKCSDLVEEAKIKEIKTFTIYDELNPNHLWKRK
ncbi:MAG: hypothetical protein K6A43_12920 [Treponema sp.]|nr:hypothetical protein [Treponema sp.]